MNDEPVQSDQGTSHLIELYMSKLEERLAGGLQFTNMLGFMNQEETKENKALLYSLIELLISKDVIHLHEIEQRKQKVTQALNKSEEHGPRVHLIDTPDKYAQESAPVDCASYYPICKGVCCKLWFALSLQDLEERIVKWNYSYPYGIAQDQDGYCIHFDHSSYKCTIYENRPLTCRTYDCREDKRIWLDFENKVLNPEVHSQLR